MRIDSKPPATLLADNLIGVFGHREREAAAKIIIKFACEESTWNIYVHHDDFLDQTGNAGLLLDGFEYLKASGYLEEPTGNGYFTPTWSFVAALIKARPVHFPPVEPRLPITIANTSEPPPIPNGEGCIFDLVVKDLQDRDKFGAQKYGTRLQPNNGRKPLADAYQELLDLVVYVRQELEERTILINKIARAFVAAGLVMPEDHYTDEKSFLVDVENNLAEVQQLIELNTLSEKKERGEVWLWDADGGNDLDSLTCPIIIHPEDMKKIIDPNYKDKKEG